MVQNVAGSSPVFHPNFKNKEKTVNPSVSDRNALDVQANMFVAKTFGWMFLALILTGVTSMMVMSSENAMNMLVTVNDEGKMESSSILFLFIVVELVAVFTLIFAIDKIPAVVGFTLFFMYAAMNGVTIAPLVFSYTAGSATSAFFVCALIFGLMSVIGLTTKQDMTKLGPLFCVALMGLIGAMFVNLLIRNSMMDFIISGAAVVIFTGLIAYDAQKVKNMASEDDKASIMGALALYLDFLNLFLHLLRLMGTKK